MNYKKHYDSLITTRLLLKEIRIEEKLKKLNYYEGHHIIPKSEGGEGRSYNFSHPNIVLLTAREHFIAHWLLSKFNPTRSNIHSFWKMCIKNNTPEKYCSSIAYEEARKLHSLSMIGNKNAVGNNTKKSNTSNMKWSDEKRKNYTKVTKGKKKNSQNMIGNKYFLGKKRDDIREVKSKKVTDGTIIFSSKKECEEKLNISTWIFYVKLKNNEIRYI